MHDTVTVFFDAGILRSGGGLGAARYSLAMIDCIISVLEARCENL